ncbi:MAG: DUF192 domain-containing protein [Rhodoblastus sp.]
MMRSRCEDAYFRPRYALLHVMLVTWSFIPARLCVLLAAFFCAFLAGAPSARAQNLEKLEFLTDGGARTFSVEVMRTPEQQAKGLMFRRYMPDDRGMLFTFGRNEPAYMWMKNTYIPLDMIFIDRKGAIVSIAADTEPFSERTIESGVPVWGVVELNAGAAAKIGLKVGDRAVHPFFDGK